MVHAWQAAGPPGSPALVLLHGWMATAALNWHAALPQLGRHFRAVAPNLRGHGSGGRREQPFSLDSCADELAETMEQLGLRGSIAVGYSMGGAVAQVLARRHPDLLAGIVLCATASEFAGNTWLRPAVRAVARAGSAAARQWPGAASDVLAWRLRRHDQAVARRTARSPGPANRPSHAHVPAPPTGSAGAGLPSVPAAAGADGAQPHATPLDRALHADVNGTDGPGPSRQTSTPRGGSRLDYRCGPGGASVTGQAQCPTPAHDPWALQERAASQLAAFIEAGAELNAYDSSPWLASLRVPGAVVVTTEDAVVAPWRQDRLAALLGAHRYEVAAGHDAVVARPELFLPVLIRACNDLHTP